MKYHKQPLVTILLMSLALVTAYLHAGTMNDLINHYRIRGDQIIKDKKGKFTRFKQLSNEASQQYQQVIDKVKNSHRGHFGQTKLSPMERSSTGHNLLNQSVPQVIIFISLTMPELSIKQIIQDAARYEIPVVLRGLYRNSFKETMSKIFDLVKEPNRGGILINPRWFKQYEIQSVPAVVVSQADRFDVVYGNLHLKKALEIIAEHGDLAAVAKKILEEKGL